MRVDFVKKNISAEIEGSKKGKKAVVFFKNWKIFYCELTSATGELKKGECADLVQD
jgi:hypothetical protein